MLWCTEPQFQALEFQCVTAAIVGLDRSKQSLQAAMATLYCVGPVCYPCFGPSGSWRTSLSLDTRESLVLPKELGCTSCCFGTISAFQHWRKQSVLNTRVDPGKKYRYISGPKRVLLWVVAHLPSHTMHKVPELRGDSILIQICFARGALSWIVHFVSRHALQWLQGKRWARMAYIAMCNEWSGMASSSRRPAVWRSRAKLRESPVGIAPTVSLEACTRVAENPSHDECFKCHFEKMEVLQFFSQLNQVFSFGIVV